MARNIETTDALLVGAGIMSATLAVLLKELDPGLKLEVVEQQAAAALESSAPWNNAGTGHSAFCELNYTPMRKDGSVVRKLTSGFDKDKGFEFIVTPGGRWVTVPWITWAPDGDRLAYFARTEKSRTLIIQNVLTLRATGARLPGLTRHQTDPINRLLADYVQHMLGKRLRMAKHVTR